MLHKLRWMKGELLSSGYTSKMRTGKRMATTVATQEMLISA